MYISLKRHHWVNISLKCLVKKDFRESIILDYLIFSNLRGAIFCKQSEPRETRVPQINHLHICHNTPCLHPTPTPLPLPPPPIICITLAFHFPCVFQSSQGKLKTMIRPNLGGKQGVLWEMCE